MITLARADTGERDTERREGTSSSQPAPSSEGQADTSSEPEPPAMRSGIPEGFEDFMKPQKTLVDVYFQGRFIASALAEYTPETIEFMNPDEVVDALPGVIARQVLRNHFRGPMPTHSERVCVRPGQKDCGVLRPEFIGVIFDESDFRANVFVHPDLMAEAPSQGTVYLPEPDVDGVGLVQNLSFNHAGELDGDDRHSIFGRTRAGLGTQHLFSSWASTDRQDLSVDELGWRRDFRDHQLTLGLFEPDDRQLSVVPRHPVAGLSVGRSLERRRDLETAFATPVELFLDSRSRVELLRDGRLYDASFYEAGNRQLDTERLPGGAYNLQIRITDSAGNTRTLERFFVKTRQLAPPGERLWFVQAGRAMLRDPLARFPEDGGTALARAGLRQRVTDRLGLGFAGAATEEQALVETSLDWLHRRFQWHGSVFADSEGNGGTLVRGTAQYRDLRLTLDSQRVWNEPEPLEQDFDLLPAEVRQDRAELRAPGLGGHFFLSHRESRRSGQDEQRDSAAGYVRTLRLGGHQIMNVNVSLSRSDDDERAELGLQWRHVTPNWQQRASLGYRQSETAPDADGAFAGVSSTWRDGDRFADDLRVTASADVEPQTSSAALSGQHDSRFGRGRATVSRVEPRADNSRARTLTSAGYDTSLVASPAGAGVGGAELYGAGVLLDLEGADDTLFDVLVDGKQRFVARGGRTAAFTLPAYEDYRISLRDRGTDFVHFDNSARETVLYPGNVAAARWELQPVVILLGKLVDPDTGEPLGDLLIEGTRSVTATDPDGYFQGEILGTDVELFAREDEKRCRLDLSGIRVENGVARLGRVPCVPVEDEAVSGDAAAE